MGRRHPAPGVAPLPFADFPEQRRPRARPAARTGSIPPGSTPQGRLAQGPLPQDTLPQAGPRSPRALGPSGHQPDLLDWAPPPTHLPSQDVDAVVLSGRAFRAPAGEAFLYHLTDPETARELMAEGLPLSAGLFFRPASGVAPDLAEGAADRGGETVLLRVRRRLIRPWLVAVEREGRPGALLVSQPRTTPG